MDIFGSNNANKRKIDKALEDAQNPKPKPKTPPKPKAQKPKDQGFSGLY